MVNESGRELSLVEQKKLKWAKEREEMEHMSEMFSHQSRTKFERTSIRTFFSNSDLSASTTTPTGSFATNFTGPPCHSDVRAGFPSPYEALQQQTRSPSLPPIGKDKYYTRLSTQQQQPQQPLLVNAHDTGYNSESSPLNGSPAEVWTNTNEEGDNRHRQSDHNIPPNTFDRSFATNQYAQRNPQSDVKNINNNMKKPLGTPNSSSSGHSFSTMSQDYAAPRRKWTDRAPPQQYFDPMTRSLDSQSSRNVPLWLEKGLSEMSEDESVRSFIRGQNTPIDQNILAERAERRRKAMELQSAIKQQLLEQERLKQREKQKQLQEEQMAEQRVLQQMEVERKRYEYDQELQRDKAEKERKKQELMRLALERAEQEAKLEREKRRKTTIVQSEEQPASSMQDQAPEEGIADRVVVGTPIQLQRRESTTQLIKPDLVLVPESEVRETVPSPPQKQPELPLNNSNDRPTDIDGIALVLQNMTPVVPLTITQDIIGLNQSVNNLQIALLLAQQQQQINFQARHFNPTNSTASSVFSGSDRERTATPPQITLNQDGKLDEPTIKECVYCCKIHGMHNRKSPEMNVVIPDVPNPNAQLKKNTVEAAVAVEVQPEIEVISNENDEKATEQVDNITVPKLASGGTFIKDEPIAEEIRSDAATNTESCVEGGLDAAVALKRQAVRILTPRKHRSNPSLTSTDVGIQTDLQLLQGCNICKHQDMVLKEISKVTTVTSMAPSPAGTLSPLRHSSPHHLDGGNATSTMTTTTITTTTMIQSKENKYKGFCAGSMDSNKNEPRPKWGVNRPAFQYVKASERDPHYLRNRRRKKYQQQMVSILGSSRTQTVSSCVSSDSGLDKCDESPSSTAGTARNTCTEILPIKTDAEGKIFVNFREASFIFKEDAKKRNHPGSLFRDKIMNRRSEDLPLIPRVFHTERTLNKSVDEGNGDAMASKKEKNQLNLIKRSSESIVATD